MATVSRLPLGTYPTSVEPLPWLDHGPSRLWIKREDVIAGAIYGGNKVRKLEVALADARAAGASRLLTMGAAGSHHVLATALYGARHGFVVEAVLVSQPPSSHAERNLRVALAHGLVARTAPLWALAPLRVASRWRPGTFFVPLGGSSERATLGSLIAARELVEQIRSGDLPEPDIVVVALGSGGTAAGLAVGLEEARLRTRVVAVSVSHPSFALAVAAQRLAWSTAMLAGLPRSIAVRAARRIEVEAGFIGSAYGAPTPEGTAAMAAIDTSRSGISLDPTYTAKAFACALERVRSGAHRDVLFWHTLAAPPSTPLDEVRALPSRLQRLFR